MDSVACRSIAVAAHPEGVGSLSGRPLGKHHRPPAMNKDAVFEHQPDRTGEHQLLDVTPRLSHLLS